MEKRENAKGGKNEWRFIKNPGIVFLCKGELSIGLLHLCVLPTGVFRGGKFSVCIYSLTIDIWDVLKCWNEFYVELLSAGVSIKEIENCGCEKPVYT